MNLIEKIQKTSIFTIRVNSTNTLIVVALENRIKINHLI